MNLPNRSVSADWPTLPIDDWIETMTTLHLWTQIVGKIRLVRSPWMNHSWHVPLYVSSRGLTTSPIWKGSRMFEIEFDLVGHRLEVRVDDGEVRTIELTPKSVAAFYRELMDVLSDLGLETRINTVPNEIPNAIPLDRDEIHEHYEPEQAHRFWKALVQVDRVFKEYRAEFIGKSSPVHFFWGSFDMAVTRFCGRSAPAHSGGVPNLPDAVAREAYSHEVISAGFWPGGNGIDASFYAYAYPEPEGFSDVDLTGGAYYSSDLGEYLLPYEEVRTAASPDEKLLEFLNGSYETAARLADWDLVNLRADFERDGP